MKCVRAKVSACVGCVTATLCWPWRTRVRSTAAPTVSVMTTPATTPTANCVVVSGVSLGRFLCQFNLFYNNDTFV